MALGKNIKHLRTKREGWDQQTLAEKASVDVGTISALEVRDSKRSQFVANFARAFGVPADVLMIEDPREFDQAIKSLGVPPPKAGTEGLSRAAIEVARAWMLLPDYKQRGYAQAIMVDAAVVKVFPEVEKAMKLAATAADPNYHKLLDKLNQSREVLKKQLELDLKNDP